MPEVLRRLPRSTRENNPGNQLTEVKFGQEVVVVDFLDELKAIGHYIQIFRDRESDANNIFVVSSEVPTALKLEGVAPITLKATIAQSKNARWGTLISLKPEVEDPLRLSVLNFVSRVHIAKGQEFIFDGRDRNRVRGKDKNGRDTRISVPVGQKGIAPITFRFEKLQ